MGLETATFLNDLVTTNPVSGDSKSQGDDHLRLVKSAAKTTFPNADKAFYFPDSVNKTANYTVVAADMSKVITVSTAAGAVSLTLPTLAASDDGWQIWVVKTNSDANAITLVGTINGAANLSFSGQYQAAKVWWSGTAWYCILMASLPLVLTNINITGGTAETTPAVGDELPVYDLSATANKKMTFANFMKILGLLTAETAPAVDDLVGLYDLSETAANSMTLENLFKVINVFTALTSVDPVADKIAVYDDSAAAIRAVAGNKFMGLVPLFKVTVAGAAEADFTAALVASMFDGTYDRIVFILEDITVATDDDAMCIRVKGAGSFETAGYHWQGYQCGGGVVGGGGSTIATFIQLNHRGSSNGIGNAANEKFTGTVECSSPDVAGFCLFDGTAVHIGADGNLRKGGNGGHWNTAGAVTGVRFLTATGGNFSGTIAGYGVRKVP